MIVAKWGNSLAVRLPKELVDELGLTEGDDLAIIKAKASQIEVAKQDAKKAFLEDMQNFQWQAGRNWKFDRDDANRK